MKEIDNKIFRKALHQFPYNSESSGDYLFNIVSVKSFEKDDFSILVEIETHLPGRLIGAKGWQINGIKELMEHYSQKKVQIHIKESEMFNNIYQ